MLQETSRLCGSTVVSKNCLMFPGSKITFALNNFGFSSFRPYSAYSLYQRTRQWNGVLEHIIPTQKDSIRKGKCSIKLPAISYSVVNFGFSISNIRQKHTMPRVPRTRMNGVYEIEGAITDEEAARQFVYALNINERKHLYAELAKFQVDTNTPIDPLLEKPTKQQLRQVALHQMFPFIGFGFLDNFLMIVAGEYIDVTLGVTLGISTMAAAALGNLISDIAGLGSAHYVEILAAKVGVKNPHLSPAQVDMGSTKFASNMGKIIGVTIGCLLGMLPLLFFTGEKREEKKNTSETNLSSGLSTHPSCRDPVVLVLILLSRSSGLSTHPSCRDPVVLVLILLSRSSGLSTHPSCRDPVVLVLILLVEIQWS
ncbi:Transmembrane protein 65 [Bulinus truncatus]|nr:Transmembrane protein 65 [Bulinus truncatus]